MRLFGWQLAGWQWGAGAYGHSMWIASSIELAIYLTIALALLLGVIAPLF
jgi:hypothetical protein